MGKKVFTLQTLPAKDEQHYGQLAQIGGFSLHAGVFADSHQTDKLERLCRYIARVTNLYIGVTVLRYRR